MKNNGLELTVRQYYVLLDEAITKLGFDGSDIYYPAYPNRREGAFEKINVIKGLLSALETKIRKTPIQN